MKHDKPWWRSQIALELTCAVIIVGCGALANSGTAGAYIALFVTALVVGYIVLSVVRR